MNITNLDEALKHFPCYPYLELDKQTLNMHTPISTTYPIQKEMLAHKKIKKLIDKQGGDLTVISFKENEKPKQLENNSQYTFTIDNVSELVTVLYQFPVQYKGFRGWSVVIQFKE